MSWTHYTNPIFVGTIKSHDGLGGGLIFRPYLIEHTGSTNGLQQSFTFGPGQTITDVCNANGLTLHYGPAGATTNINRGFTVQGPENVVLDPDTTETDLSGLAALTNAVTHIHDATNTDIYRLGTNCRFVLAAGSELFHDPDKEHLIIQFNRPSEPTSGPTGRFYSDLQITDATYNYGVETTSNGRTSYSQGCGLSFTADGVDNWNPRDVCFSTSGGGLLKTRGGVIHLNKAINGLNQDVKKTTFHGTRTQGAIQEWRSFGGVSFDGKISGLSLMAISSSLDIVSLEINQGLVSELLGSFNEITLRDFDVSKNPYVVDVGPDSPKDRGHRDYLIINSVTGSDIIAMWRDQRTSNSQKGNVVTCKEVSFNIYDTTSQPIEGCKMYLVDNPSNYARDVTYTAGSVMNNSYDNSVTPANAPGFITGTHTLLNGTLNSDGTVSYNYANAIEYEKTTDASGNVPTFQVITSTQLKPFTANTESTEASAFYDNYNGGWKESDGASPAFSDWDTDRFGGYYKVDRRSNSNSNLDDFTFKFCSYGHLLSSSARELRGAGELSFDWVLVEDSLITETKAITDAYTVIDTAEKFYNKAKAYLVDNYAGETETLVSRSGTTLDAGDNNIVLDPSAATAFDLTDATFSTFSGVFITAAAGNPASQAVVITANTAGNVTIEIVGNDTDTVATLAAAQGATATGDGASEVLASGDSNKITVTGGSNPIITIKCTSFTGNLTTTETITVNSGVTVLGTIIDANNPAGLSSRAFSISNVILGTTIQIYNETQVTKRGTTEGYSPANVYETLIASGTTISSTLIGDGTSTIAQLIAAQSLTADPMADTSYVLPSGWVLATTEVANDNNRVTISGVYDEGTVPNGDFDAGDSVRIRATCAAAAGAFLPFVNTTIANEGGFSLRVNQQPDTIYNDNGIDGSASTFDGGTLTITEDYANLQIDVADTDDPGKITVQEVYAKYAYLITTTSGIEHFFGAITAENPTNFRINTDIIDLKLQNISASDMILTGARLYRSDFTTVIEKGYIGNDPANGPAGTFSHDTGELVQFIRPQVESAIDLKDVATSTGVNAVKADTEAVKKKTNLIPGLL